MIARRRLPARYEAWNRRWGAPDGRPWGRRIGARAPGLTARFPRLIGPFGFQDNSSTRRWEYPWAYAAAPPRPGQTVVEIGGSLSGFQFTLSAAGADVTNIDPGTAATGLGWRVEPDTIHRLNTAFGTDVRLVPTTLEQAALPEASVDTVFSISTLEHIPAPEVPGLLREIERVLRPGGRFVATVDLFLDLAPFTSRTENRWGTNLDLGALLAPLEAELVVGNREELLGCQGFGTERVLLDLPDYLIGSGFPVLAQCFVLQKPTSS